MTKMKFTTTSVVTAILLMTASAQADIRVTLASGTGPGSTQTQTEAGSTLNGVYTPDLFTGTFTVGNYSLTLQTTVSNTPVTNGDTGSLSSTSIFATTTGSGTLADLTVTVVEVGNVTADNPNGTPVIFGSSSPSNYDVLNAANVNIAAHPSVSLTGSAQIDANNPNVASVSVNTMNTPTGIASNTETVMNVSGYTLAQTYILSGVQGGTSNLDVGFNTSVSPTNSPAVVPEPSSLVLTGLAAVGLGGVALRRHRRARPI